jgi:F0F1-type ATP synthase assembly protein I
MVGVGMEFAGVVVVLLLGGWWLDGKWNTSPTFTLIGLGIGLVGGVYNLWRVGKRFF